VKDVALELTERSNFGKDTKTHWHKQAPPALLVPVCSCISSDGGGKL
jgi:hypothetical protein